MRVRDAARSDARALRTICNSLQEQAAYQTECAGQASGNGPTSGNATLPKSLDDALLGAMLPRNAPVAGASTGSTGAVDHAQSAAMQGMLPKNSPVAGAATGSTGASCAVGPFKIKPTLEF